VHAKLFLHCASFFAAAHSVVCFWDVGVYVGIVAMSPMVCFSIIVMTSNEVEWHICFYRLVLARYSAKPIVLKQEECRMGFFTGLLTTAIGMTAYHSFVRSFYQNETDEQEIHFFRTGDHWRLACKRYVPAEPLDVKPIVLCHGLGSNHSTFDLAPEVSLARFLAQEGFDVWSFDLRGHGASARPLLFNQHRYGWSFDDYVLQDVPALLQMIRAQTGFSQVHWIGHSMGGLLLYAYLSRNNNGSIRSGITVGSGLDYSGSSSQFGSLLKWRWLLRMIPALPYGHAAAWLAPFAGRFQLPPERFLYHPENTSSSVARALLVNNCHAISSPVLHQLATTFTPGGLQWKDDTTRYMDQLGLSDVPVLALAGDRDLQCPVELVERPIAQLKKQGSKVQVFGKEHGCHEHYGHFDLLLGRHVRSEVYPHIVSWLKERD
jgi:pimeloyl-ACP methyl ester carboxylesterase